MRAIDQRLLDFAARIVKLAGGLPRSVAGRHIARQLLRAGTSPAASYEEAQAAESRADSIHKLQIALKELRQSNYWLRLIAASEILPFTRLAEIIAESEELKLILSQAVETAKGANK